MKRAVWTAIIIAVAMLAVSVGYVSVRIERQSTRDEARNADVILVLGAAEYRGRPSQVLRARLDHALELYQRKLAPLVLTTGGAGGDPVFTEGGVGRSYLIGRGVPPEAIIVENEGETTVESTAMVGEIMRGSPRKERIPEGRREDWNYVKQAIGYLLWRAGLAV